MPKSFAVPVRDSEYIVNPTGVTFLRPKQLRVAEHDSECSQGEPACVLQFPENAQLPDRLTCFWSAPVDATEICFINTISAESSVITPLSIRDVRNLFDEAIRYNI